MPHFRVRTLMAVVAVVALVLWGAMMGSRSYSYYKLATAYEFQERGWREENASGNLRCDECVPYFAMLTRKYRRAMWRPWVPLAPDPHAPGYDEYIKQLNQMKKQGP